MIEIWAVVSHGCIILKVGDSQKELTAEQSRNLYRALGESLDGKCVVRIDTRDLTKAEALMLRQQIEWANSKNPAPLA